MHKKFGCKCYVKGFIYSNKNSTMLLRNKSNERYAVIYGENVNLT